MIKKIIIIIINSGSLRFKENENDPGKRFKFTTFTLFIQCIINALVSFIAIYVIKLTKKTNNTTSTSLGITRDAAKKFILLAITQSVAMMSSSKAVFYVSYPTQVIAKCCKPIPILITGLILKSSSYSKSRILSVVLITIGVTIFMYQNAVSSASAKAPKGNKNNNSNDRGSLVGWWIGIGYLCVSLLADGFTGHFQNRIKDVHYKSMDKSISSWHMMLFSNVFSAAFFFVGKK